MDVSFNFQHELAKFVAFIKRPVWSPEPHQSLQHKLFVLSVLLIFNLCAGVLLGALIQVIQSFEFFEPTAHEMEQMLREQPKYYLFLLVVVIAPLVEELIFRGPLVYTAQQKNAFPYFFYTSVLLFGFVHLSNYEMNPSVILFAPILVSAQLVTGITFGYTRVKFGLGYSIILHAAYNGILFFPLLFIDYA